MLILNCF